MEAELTHNTFDKWIDEILHFAKAGDKQTDVKRRELLEKVHDLRVFDGHTPAERSEMSAKLINAMISFWKYRKETFMGFQASQGLESNKDRLGELLNMQLNNIGDPFYDNSGFRLNCKVAERAVLAYYGLLWCGESELGASVQPGSSHAELPDEKPQRDENATSGYVTCMGSTEGNTYILRQARDYLKGKFLFPKSKRDLENPSPRPKLGAVTVMAKRLQSDEQASITLKFKKSAETSVTSVPVRAKLDGATMVFDARTEREKETGVDSSSSASQSFREPILLYSKASHYSIGKIKDMLEIHTPETFMRSKGEGKTPQDVFTKAECDAFFPDNRWPSRLPIYEDGTINLGVLKLLVRFFFSKGNPLIVLCNYGTTFTGVYDDPEQVTKIIRADPGVAEEEYTKQQDVDETTISFKRRNYFIACDGALGAAYGSYWEGGPNGSKQRSGPMCTEYLLTEYLQQAANALSNGNASTTHQCPYAKVLKSLEAEGFPLTPSEDIILPCFNLRRSDGVMAISMSSHKFLGAPTPGGLVLTVRKYMLDFTGDDVSYIGSPDTSISGSRSGLNVMFMYDYLARHSHAMQIAKSYSAMNLARYAAAHIASKVFGASPVQVARDKPTHALTPYEASLRSGGEKSNSPAPAVFHFAGSLSVIFPRPEDWIIDKYSLSCDEMRLYKCDGYSFTSEYLESEAGKRLVKEHPGHEILPDGGAAADGEYPKVKRGPYYMLQCAHIFAMGHVTVDMVKALAADLKTDARLKALAEALSRCNKKA